MSELIYVFIGFLLGCVYMLGRRDHRVIKTYEQVDQEVRDELQLNKNLVASLKDDLAFTKKKLEAFRK